MKRKEGERNEAREKEKPGENRFMRLTYYVRASRSGPEPQRYVNGVNLERGKRTFLFSASNVDATKASGLVAAAGV